MSGKAGHARRVCSLYKRIIRNVENYYSHRAQFRYEAVIVRDEFNENKKKDLKTGKKLLSCAEQLLFKFQHYCPKKFPNSPGGVAYEREVIPPDWVMDYWHPLEKAQYPEYFARREKAKQWYLENWETLGQPSESDGESSIECKESKEPPKQGDEGETVCVSPCDAVCGSDQSKSDHISDEPEKPKK